MGDRPIEKTGNCIAEEFVRLTKKKTTLKLLRHEQSKWNSWVKLYENDVYIHNGTEDELRSLNRTLTYSLSVKGERDILLEYVSELEKELIKCKGKKKKEIKKNEKIMIHCSHFPKIGIFEFSEADYELCSDCRNIPLFSEGPKIG